jgi:anaerobic selenocysteine-containing dehydrogenase
MSLERSDNTRGFEHIFSEPFAQHTGPILERPGDVIEDWEFFFELASRMGLLLNIGTRVWEPGSERPTSEELLESFAQRAQVPYDAVRAEPHGAEFDVSPIIVGPPAPDATARFELLADDVAEELQSALEALVRAHAAPVERPFLLVVRRSKNVMNSLGRRVPIGSPYNPCFVHSDDLAALGATDGDVLVLTSDHGTISVVAAADPTLRRGVLSITHCYGGLPGEDDDPRQYGANPARLLSLTEHRQPISQMPWMSAVPVSATPTTNRRQQPSL